MTCPCIIVSIVSLVRLCLLSNRAFLRFVPISGKTYSLFGSVPAFEQGLFFGFVSLRGLFLAGLNSFFVCLFHGLYANRAYSDLSCSSLRSVSGRTFLFLWCRVLYPYEDSEFD